MNSDFSTSRSSTSRHILVALSVLIVFTALVMIALNAYMTKDGVKTNVSADAGNEAYMRGYEAAKEKYASVCPVITQEVKSFSGVIKSVGADRIVVTQDSMLVDANIDAVSNDRTVLLAIKGSVLVLKEKTEQQFQAEIEAFEKNPTGTPPSRTTETKGTLNDAKVGMRVVIETDTDARLQQTINAQIIKLMVK